MRVEARPSLQLTTRNSAAEIGQIPPGEMCAQTAAKPANNKLYNSKQGILFYSIIIYTVVTMDCRYRLFDWLLGRVTVRSWVHGDYITLHLHLHLFI